MKRLSMLLIMLISPLNMFSIFPCLINLSTLSSNRLKLIVYRFTVVPLLTLSIFIVTGLMAPVFADEVKDWKVEEPIVTYWAGPMPITDNDARIMRDGGWNLVWVTQRGRPVDQTISSYYLEQLNRLARFGLRGIVPMNGVVRRHEGVIDREKLNEFGLVVNAIKGHKSLYAYHLIDEPGAGLFKKLHLVKEYILERDPHHLVYVNLYPNYAKKSKLGVSGDNIDSYREYLQLYSELFGPQIYSFDHYTFNLFSEGVFYFENLAEIRRESIKFKRPFMAILQASSWSINKRVPSPAELRWQVYTSLAYGAQGISWYVYGYPGHDGGIVFPIVDKERNKNLTGRRVIKGGGVTPLYKPVQAINREFFAIAKELQKTRSTGVFRVGQNYSNIELLPQAASFKILSDNGNARGADYLIGMFEFNEFSYGLVVNLEFGDSTFGLSKDRVGVQSNLVGRRCIEKFNVNDSTWSRIDDGFVELNLPAGSGLLVRSCDN